MLVWVVYDIQKNNTRAKVAKVCKGAGIYRVQKSVFLGDLNNNQMDELGLKIKSLIDLDNDSAYIFPMCRPDFSRTKLIGQAFDRKMVTDEIRALFV